MSEADFARYVRQAQECLEEAGRATRAVFAGCLPFGAKSDRTSHCSHPKTFAPRGSAALKINRLAITYMSTRKFNTDTFCLNARLGGSGR
jgi:hypothetical protein